MKLSVTGGVVSVEDGTKKPEEYAPPRKVRVELHFDVPEGEDADAHIGAVSALASAHVVSLLGGVRPSGVKPASAATTTGTPAPGSKAALEADLAAKGASPAMLGHEPQAAAQPAQGPKRTKASKPPAETPQAPPAADPDELTETPPAAEKPAAVPAEDDLGDLTGDTPPLITDAELNAAAAKRNQAIKSGLAIRKLVGKFMTDTTKPAQLPLIPQKKRAQFLKELETLQAE